ncbi:maleylpyruvate isomerase family mycothiol-dependent enzyme [Streptomyces cinnabarinus]|uniref:Maleylpyruvate isomerase family mycothiol-dependent enzyme n=1 Tax=Streptomyces cinnabarinus TaxID=67287 RepID=A0ABY7K909_9ACTN|nr:maleylpyruvate isomerase family mycothiol-dependent enzyme [Streptomyces cinnabarinus]WAZ20859.1 maleylpyruvate isomerase family mycothiol-dependent enzyme [Streptomyces cinnabarinus]
MTEHEDVRELLAAWAFGALDAAEAERVRPHLAGCKSCAAEAARLRETVRLLDGPPIGGLPARPATGLPPALLARRPSAPRTAVHAAPYAAAVQGLRALLPEAAGRWTTPVVHDWDVHATVAHLLAADEALAGRLGIPARVPATVLPQTVLPQDMRWEDAWDRRTADVIAHEHGRTPEQTVAAWGGQADALLATPEARDAELAARAELLMGIRLPVADHFVVRAFEAWIHTDDIGRALGLVVPPPPAEHLGQLVRLAVRVLGLALGPDAAPVLFSVSDGEQWVLGSEDEPVAAELALDPVDFCLLVGGRCTPAEVPRGASGDAAAVRNVLETAASLAWL